MNKAKWASWVVLFGFLSAVAVAQDQSGTAVEPSSGEEGKSAEAGPAGEGDDAADAATEGEMPSSSEESGDGTATQAEDNKSMDAGTYSVRLRDLEQRINELKEQIFRSKARLSLLAETVLQGVVAGAQAIIIHENRMSSSYLLVGAVYALDGAPIFTKTDEQGALGDRDRLEIYNGSIIPGEHTLTVNLEYRGHGFGVFSYLKGYRFKVRSNYSFAAPEGRRTTIRVVGFEKGGPTAPLEDRPAIRYIENVSSIGKTAAAASEQGGS